MLVVEQHFSIEMTNAEAVCFLIACFPDSGSGVQRDSHVGGLQGELPAGHLGGLLCEALVALRLLPQVVVLHTLPHRARPYLRQKERN